MATSSKVPSPNGGRSAAATQAVTPKKTIQAPKPATDGYQPAADIGDYMKALACTAVIMQAVLTLVLKTNPSQTVQTGVGVLYNFVKYTAPAFIFGILYSTLRNTLGHGWRDYPHYLRQQWSALFVPTLWWTSIYLVFLPGVQQVNHWHGSGWQAVGSFLWHFVNGNAAPHLWYNTMMLQFIILMPFFWMLAKWAAGHTGRAVTTLVLTIVIAGLWLWFYDTNVFGGPHATDWYLFDRLFVSFLIYAVFGILAVIFRKAYRALIMGGFWVIAAFWAASFVWTNLELHGFGFPVKLTNAPYYKPSMTIYALMVIGLISALALRNAERHSTRLLTVFHFLSTYAYRAYLSNVFWLQVLNKLFGQGLTDHPVAAIVGLYVGTWALSFGSAYGLHVGWTAVKAHLATLGQQQRVDKAPLAATA